MNQTWVKLISILGASLFLIGVLTACPGKPAEEHGNEEQMVNEPAVNETAPEAEMHEENAETSAPAEQH